jgi:hypothetical protein
VTAKMPVPWFLHPCSRTKDRKAVDGYLCCEDDREFDIGEERPFLVHAEVNEHLRPPPPEQLSGRFTRRYGVHRPVCCGRCLVSDCNRDNLMWMTVLLLLVPSTTWAVFVAPHVQKEIGFWPNAIGLAFLLLTIFFLILTWLTEPGILPTSEMEDRSNQEKPARLTFVVIHGQFFSKATFRAQTSRFTSSCIEGFDHYCPYVGNAVGKRNYRYFIAFLTSAFMLSASVTLCAIAVVYKKREDDDVSLWKAVERSAGATVLAGFCFVIGLSLSCLLQYHLKLIIVGRTTYEDLKHVFMGKENPHDRGCVRNCLELWCSPHYPSRVVGNAVSVVIESTTDVLQLNESLLFSPTTPLSARGTSPRAAINPPPPADHFQV